MIIVMGNSIANDPCYGGELFYGDGDRRQRALEVLRNMRKEGKHPLSKVPHLGDPELDNYIPNTTAVTVEAQSMGSDKSTGVCVEAKAEVKATVEGSDDKRKDSIAADKIACSSVPLVPAPTPVPVADDKSSVSVIATAANKESIESETVVDVAGESAGINGNSAAVTSITPGIEEETEGKVEVEVEVEVQGGTETDKEYLVRTCRYGSTQFSTVHYPTLQCTALHCTALHCTATYCTVLLCNFLSLPVTYCVGTVGKRRKVKSWSGCCTVTAYGCMLCAMRARGGSSKYVTD